MSGRLRIWQGPQPHTRSVLRLFAKPMGFLLGRDLIFGSGQDIQPGQYQTPNGVVTELKPHAAGTYVLVSLYDVYNKGDEIEFEATLPIKDGFLNPWEWVAVKITDAVMGPAHMKVLFPIGSQLQEPVTLEVDLAGRQRSADITDHADIIEDKNGQSRHFIAFTVKSPRAGATYTIRWTRTGVSRDQD